MNEIYISIDVEADGPIPGPYSMISFGAVAFMKETGVQPLDKFSVNLKALPGAGEHPATMEFWKKNWKAYEATTENQQDPSEAMESFMYWIMDLKLKYEAEAVLVGFPGGFDFMFLHWYLCNEGYDPSHFGYSILDIKSYAMAILKEPYLQCTKKFMPKDWKTKSKSHTHLAVDDAEEQGKIFMRMLCDNLWMNRGE
jgi:hypothetical protein